MVPQAATIYVAPSDHHMVISAREIRLNRGLKENHARPAIDPLFRTAALEFGPGVIGVVLTGMLDDGAAGLKAIKDCGGITIVQDPHDAPEPSMPLSTLAKSNVDYMTTINKLAELLEKLVAMPVEDVMVKPLPSLELEHAASVGDNAMQKLKAIGKPSTFSCPDCGGVMFELNEPGPARYRCHPGHAMGLLSLVATQKEVADDALWTALRALQEKEAGLRRLAESTPPALPRHSDLLTEADALASAAATLRALTVGEPRQAQTQAV